MDKKKYGTLASATRVERPECADDGDLLVLPPGNPVRSMTVPSIARLGMRCGNTCRSDNSYEAVDELFRGGRADAPIVLRIHDTRKHPAPSGRRAQMLALIGNGREADGEPQAAIWRCTLSLVYNGKSIPRSADRAIAADLLTRRVGELMERLHQSGVTQYSGAVADVATEIAWSAFSTATGVMDESRPRSNTVPETGRRGGSATDWNVGGNLSPSGRTDVAGFLVECCPTASPTPVIVSGRFLAEAGKRGCVVVRCPQASAFATRAKIGANAERCAEAWRCRVRALELMRSLALKDLAVARARAANFSKIAREVSDGKADYAFLQCMSGWDK